MVTSEVTKSRKFQLLVFLFNWQRLPHLCLNKCGWFTTEINVIKNYFFWQQDENKITTIWCIEVFYPHSLAPPSYGNKPPRLLHLQYAWSQLTLDMCIHLEECGTILRASPRIHVDPPRHGGQAVPGVLHNHPPALTISSDMGEHCNALLLHWPETSPWPPPRPPQPARSPRVRRCRKCGQSGGWWPERTGPIQPRQQCVSYLYL